jgi:hypothetical protein
MPPAPGIPVVVLTDLGIAQPHGAMAVAGAEEWREFASNVSRAQCPLLALVPYPARRWPAGLHRVMTILQWDRATTAAVVRKVVGSGLRVNRES